MDGGLTYTQVAGGAHHTVLLRSDGTAVACGYNDSGRCDLAAVEGGLTNTQVAGGLFHTVLLRSDGTAAACGYNICGQCDLPALEGGLTFACSFRTFVLQASFDGTSMHFMTLGGEELCHFEAAATDHLADLRGQLVHDIGSMCSRVDVVLPGGKLISKIISEEPLTVLKQVFIDILHAGDRFG